MLHKFFLFDYDNFIKNATALVPSVEQGNYQRLLTDASDVFDHILAEKWLLHDQGTTLERFSLDDINGPFEVGYLLLVVLSKYLSNPMSPGKDWPILYKALKQCGWNERACRLLMDGKPTSLLIKPDVITEAGEKRKDTSPYYQWIMPSQAYHTGWLNLDQINFLESELFVIRKKLTQVNIQGLCNQESVQDIEIRERLQQSWESAVSILNTAKNSASGLFMVVS